MNKTPNVDGLQQIRHIVLDMDGTIYKGIKLFDCTLPFLAYLRETGIGYTFLTNNTSRSKSDYVHKLAAFGIECDEQQIYTPADSAIVYLRRHHDWARSIAVLGTPSLSAEFEQAGFRVTWDDPEAVVVGFDTTLTYDRLCRAAWWICQGLPFIATHPDLVCPTDEPTVLVDCGSICAALTAATGRAPAVLGKPDPSILLDLCECLGLAPREIAMVGDRIYTDMAMARAAEAFAVLVLSGEATAADVPGMQTPPDLIVHDIGEFGKLLCMARNGRSKP
ncbi:MAG TPA: HAD-IIA family hydrolase [Bryobacteraceae bacterium]